MTTSNYFQFTHKDSVVQGHHLAQGYRTSKSGLLNLSSVLLLYLTASSHKDFRFLERLGHGRKGRGLYVNLCLAWKRGWYSLFPCWESQRNLHFFQWFAILDGCCKVITESCCLSSSFSKQSLLEQHWFFMLVYVFNSSSSNKY